MKYQRRRLQERLSSAAITTILSCALTLAATAESNGIASKGCCSSLNKIETELLKSVVAKDDKQFNNTSSKKKFQATILAHYTQYRDNLSALHKWEDEISESLRNRTWSKVTSPDDEIELEYRRRRILGPITVSCYEAHVQAEAAHSRLKKLLDQGSVEAIDSYLGNTSCDRRIFDYKGPLDLGFNFSTDRS